MNKSTLLLLLIFMLLMTACSGNMAGTDSATQSGPAAGELSAPMQVAIGTIKLGETDNAVTMDQAVELLPLWQTLELLYTSDTAAEQEIDALVTQIQETMTAEQTQAIIALNLTRQDMMSVMQSQGIPMGAAPGGNTQSNNSSDNGERRFEPGQEGIPGGGGFGPAGGPNFQGPRPDAQSTGSTDTTARQAALDPDRIPTPLLQAVIEYLEEKAGS